MQRCGWWSHPNLKGLHAEKSPYKKQIKVEEFSSNYNHNKIKKGQMLNFDWSYWQKFQKKTLKATGIPACFIPANNIILVPSYSMACTVSKPWSWTLLYRQALITPFSSSAVCSRTKTDICPLAPFKALEHCICSPIHFTLYPEDSCQESGLLDYTLLFIHSHYFQLSAVKIFTYLKYPDWICYKHENS